MRDIMIDLETLSLDPHAAILSIGACYFNRPDTGLPEIGPVFYRNVTIQSNIEAGRIIDGSTVEWWMEQSEAARRQLFENPAPIPLVEALVELSAFCEGRSLLGNGVSGNLFPTMPADEPVPTYIWSHGAPFDLPIVTSACKRLGLPAPWFYRNARDTRTLFELTELLCGACPPSIAEVVAGEAHNALHDAIVQAHDVVGCLRALQDLKGQAKTEHDSSDSLAYYAPIWASDEMKEALARMPAPTCECVPLSIGPTADDHHNDSALGAEFPLHRPELHPAPAIETDDWITWTGGDCPLRDGVRFQMCFRSGTMSTATCPGAFCWRWASSDQPTWNADYDIVAYRVLADDPPRPSQPPKHIPVG